MDVIFEFLQMTFDTARRSIFGVLYPNDRMFSVYLLTSGLMAFFIYRHAQKKADLEEKTFLQFLFPKRVWSHPSAWLDLRYFVFNSIFGKVILLGISAGATAITYKLVALDAEAKTLIDPTQLSIGAQVAISFTFMFVSMAFTDFLAWFCHYLQHKSPLLWQFHKVHHSSEVMHPVSNFREHPVDNVLYLSVIGAGYGFFLGLVARVLGYFPSIPMLLGVPLLMLAFNLVGYNLRHSHIWLRWPGKWSMIFPSPAHHHVHHSSHPDHIDKNFAFMFPIWDVVFKTYEMPEDDRDVKFGIGEGNAEELNTCARLYWVPFRDAYRVVLAQIKGVEFNMSKPEKVEDRKIHPAE